MHVLSSVEFVHSLSLNKDQVDYPEPTVIARAAKTIFAWKRLFGLSSLRARLTTMFI